MSQENQGNDYDHLPPGGARFCRWCISNWPEYSQTDGICVLLSIKPTLLQETGVAEVEATFPSKLRNPFGSIHGGTVSMLLDHVGGLAVCSLLGFAKFGPTVEMKTKFLKPANPGFVRARAYVCGKDGQFVRVHASVFQGDIVFATAESRFLPRGAAI